MARKNNSRRKQQSRQRHQATNHDSDSDDGYLIIGGVRINVTPHGNVAGMSQKRIQRQQRRRQQHKFSSSSSSGSDESPLQPEEIDSDDMLDYFRNIGVAVPTTVAGKDSDQGIEGGSEDDGILATSSGRRRHFEMLRRFGGVEIGDEGAPEDIIGRFYDEDEDSESEEEDEDSDASSLYSSSDDGSDGGGGSLSSFSSDDDEDAIEEDGALLYEEDRMDVEQEGVLTLEELEQLPTSTRYPVAVRPTPVLVSGEKQGNSPPGGGKKGKGGGKKKGRHSGKFAPGEKARLRREKIESKRAERAMGRGFDLAGINKELENFVAKQHDMHAFPPMPKRECRQVQKLAALYGCKAGAQGSGKKRSVMVVMTERTAMPEGVALLEIGKLLTAHTAAELGKGTSAIPGLWVGPGGNTIKESRKSNDDLVIKSGKGRWADFKEKGPRSSKSAARKRQERALDITNNNTSGSSRRKHLRPVNFVSRGIINPDEDVFEIYQHPGKEESDVEVEEDAGPSSLLPVFEDRRGGSSPSSRSSSGGEDEGEDDEDFRPMLGIPIAHDDEEEDTLASKKLAASAAERSKRKKETQKRKKENARLHSGGSGGLLSFSSRGADAAEGITNSGRLLGLGMALGIGAQVFSTSGVAGDDRDSQMPSAADLSPLEPMLSKSAQKKLAKQKKRGSGNGNGSSSKQPSSSGYVSSPSRKQTVVAAGATTAGAAPGVSGDFGDLENHTTGIGSKLLAKWGFAGVGSGLGRGGTGISEPLQVKMRAKGLGLGAER